VGLVESRPLYAGEFVAMAILVTNDDGIHAPGLAVAEAIARAI
jgi:hypothetical protein